MRELGDRPTRMHVQRPRSVGSGSRSAMKFSRGRALPGQRPDSGTVAGAVDILLRPLPEDLARYRRLAGAHRRLLTVGAAELHSARLRPSLGSTGDHSSSSPLRIWPRISPAWKLLLWTLAYAVLVVSASTSAAKSPAVTPCVGRSDICGRDCAGHCSAWRARSLPSAAAEEDDNTAGHMDLPK